MGIASKTWIKWSVLALAFLLLAGGVVSALSARKAKSQALAAATAAGGALTQSTVELAGTDVIKLKTLALVQGLPISGSLKAANSAVIKARVAGELQGLTVREGDFVKAGQVIARIDASENQSRVRQTREQAASAKAQVDVAQRQYDNNKALVEQGFISKTSLDTSLANLNAAQATYKAALAATEVAAKSVDDTVLRSPISGQVSQRMAQPGERVGVDTKIIEVLDLSRVELEASLNAADSLKVKVGQSALLTLDGSGQVFNATVARINPVAAVGSRAVLAYLRLAPGANLRHGLFAQGALQVGTANTLALPLSAVRTDKPQPYVQLMRDSQVQHVDVTLGPRGDTAGVSMVAVAGVSEGSVVINGTMGSLRPGTLVKLATPAQGIH